MGIRFSAGEVFGMAIDIEANGAAFYRRAAEVTDDDSSRNFLIGLARMEDGHKATFEEMQSDLQGREAESTAADPDDEEAMYLASVADTHGGEGSPSVADSLTGSETMQTIVQIALELEKKSVLFYVGMKDMVSAKMGKARIDDIIREEKKHIASLSHVLETL